MGAGRKAEQMTMTLVETMECWTLNQFEPVLEAESWFKREGFPAEGYPHFDSFDANWLTPWLDAHDTPELRVAVAESIERQLRGRVGREAIANMVLGMSDLEVVVYGAEHGGMLPHLRQKLRKLNRNTPLLQKEEEDQV